jgi:arylsulfatase A-like enzyme
MQRRQFLSLAAAPLVRAQARKPNIVWIMADDMAWGDPGCYGQKFVRTPNIDTLARDGMRFTDAYAGSTVCAPSRSVLLTGMHGGHTSVRSNPGGVPILDSDVTIGEVLRPAGYKSGCFGKWGLGDIGTEGVPWKQGFDEFFGYLHQAHAHYFYPPYLYDNDKQFDLPRNRGVRMETYSHDLIADRTFEFIRKNRNNPFFCYAAWTPPHWEPQVPEDSLAPYRGKLDPEFQYVDKAGRLNPQRETYAAYAGMVSRIDRGVGRILDLLRELNLAENTLVFFTSDNGGPSRQAFDPENRLDNYGPFRGHKTTMYEGGLRVPMLARWPGVIPAGRVSDFPWMFMDALPTMAEVAGAAAPAGIDGQSVIPTLTGKPQKPHDYLYWENPPFNSKESKWMPGAPPQAMRAGDWKVVRPKLDAPLELYDLKTDPGESRDLASSRKDVMAAMEKKLASARTPPRSQSQPPHRWFDKPWW